MKNKKSILNKFESDKINQMQKITGGDPVKLYYCTGTSTVASDWGWFIYIGHGDYKPA